MKVEQFDNNVPVVSKTLSPNENSKKILMKKKSIQQNLDDILHSTIKTGKCKSKNGILFQSGVSPWDLTPNGNSMLSSLRKDDPF